MDARRGRRAFADGRHRRRQACCQHRCDAAGRRRRWRLRRGFGSYATAADAQRVVKALQTAQLPGYRETTRSGERTLHRVRIGPYASQAEAEAARLAVGARSAAMSAPRSSPWMPTPMRGSRAGQRPAASRGIGAGAVEPGRAGRISLPSRWRCQPSRPSRRPQRRREAETRAPPPAVAAAKPDSRSSRRRRDRRRRSRLHPRGLRRPARRVRQGRRRHALRDKAARRRLQRLHRSGQAPTRAPLNRVRVGPVAESRRGGSAEGAGRSRSSGIDGIVRPHP